MTRAAAIAICLLVQGCATAAPRSMPVRGEPGVYHFREHVPNTSPVVVIEGDILLMPDTLSVSLNTAPCTYDARSRDTRQIRYVCGIVTMSFDRAEPLQRNTYTVRAPQSFTQRVCAQTTINAAGQTVCVRYGSQTVMRDVTLSGRLTPMKQ